MRKKGGLSSLVYFDAPLGDIEAGLATLGWGSEPVDMMREQAADSLQRFASGERDAASVEAWANLVEGRHDIQFEPGHEQVVVDAVHDLANPVLQGRLENIVPAVLGESLLRACHLQY